MSEQPESIEDTIAAAMGESNTDSASPTVDVQDNIDVSSNETVAVESDTPAAAFSFSPPNSWKKEERELFKTWPAEAQEAITRRANEMHKDYLGKTQETAQLRKEFEPLGQIVNRYQDQLARRGLTTPQVVEQALAIDKLIHENPMEGVKWVMQRAGITPQHFNNNGQTNGVQQPQRTAAQDPTIQALQRQIQSLQGYVNQSQGVHQQQQAQQATSVVEAFKSETDDEGNPLRPYVNQLEDQMAPFVSFLRQQNPGLSHETVLQQAYDYAMSQNPDIQGQMKAEQELRAAEAARKKAENAKKAGSSIQSTPVAGGAKGVFDPNASIEETMRQVYSDLE